METASEDAASRHYTTAGKHHPFCDVPVMRELLQRRAWDVVLTLPDAVRQPRLEDKFHLHRAARGVC